MLWITFYLSYIWVCLLVSGSYTCFMRFSSKEHERILQKRMYVLAIVLLHVTIHSEFYCSNYICRFISKDVGGK